MAIVSFTMPTNACCSSPAAEDAASSGTASSELSRAQKLPRIISAYSATAASPRTGSSRPALARCRWRAAPPARYPRTRFAASLAAVSESQNMTAAMTG